MRIERGTRFSAGLDPGLGCEREGFPDLPATPRRAPRARFVITAILPALLAAAAGGCWPALQKMERDDLRLVVRLPEAASSEELAAGVSSLLGSDVSAEPLFEDVDPADDPEGLARMVVLVAPQVLLPGQNAWDVAYRVEDELGVADAQPDLDDALAAATERSALSCFVGDSIPPPIDEGWSLRNIRAGQGWALDPPAGGTRFGEGIRVCHPDTGWTSHDDMDGDRLDLDSARNLLRSGPSDARDPLDYSGPLLHPGHGTASGSVIYSGGGLDEPTGTTPPGLITGVAPLATLVPVRSAKSVVRILDSKLARAVHHATRVDCDVVSISLGGRLFFGLRAAIRDAVRRDVVVVAAAGNCVRFVVAPAAYDECLGVAGTNISDAPWKGSSRGRAVAVSAPAEHVWRAVRRRSNDSPRAVAPGEGTSFAAANVAGVAALWLGYHGRAALRARYSDDVDLQDAFTKIVRATARPAPGLDPTKFGPGIVDAAAVLAAPLPEPSVLASARRAAASPEDELATFARVVDRDRDELATAFARLFAIDESEVGEALERWGPELEYLALRDPESFEEMLRTHVGDSEAARSARVGSRDLIAGAASRSLRSALER